MSDLIERALLTATDTRTVIAGPDAIAAVAESFRATFGDRPALVVGAERTMSVAGDAVMVGPPRDADPLESWPVRIR